ncbi:MAG: HEPN domain-containing protein [Armatimonadota bacterium]
MKGQRDAAEGLLLKAHNDLFAAETVIVTGEALDTVAFHAQQTAEKSLKALLVLQAVEYPLTHDLARLLRLALAHYAALAAYEPELDRFALYGVIVRYDQTIFPSLDEARELLVIARQMYDYAMSVVTPSEDSLNT